MVNKYIELSEMLRGNETVAIYGAGVIAYNISQVLIQLYNINEIKYFVSNNEVAHGFGGIIAEEFTRDRLSYYGNPVLLVATPVQYHNEIKEVLCKANINCFYLVDSDLEYFFMSQYFHRTEFRLMEDLKTAKEKSIINETGKKFTKKIEIYMAKSVYDKPLTHDFELPEWIIPVQAGKQMTRFNIANLADDMGNNISDKNYNYSELTVTYWAWKNSKADYKGICHYRRLFSIFEEDIFKIEDNDIDVILPLPYLCAPNASEQYLRYIKSDDFDIFCRILNDINKNMATLIIDSILKMDVLYNYNMVIAKERVFDEYCEFMFGILFKLEQYYTNKGVIRRDRYLGYFGEILTSAYFIMNMDKLNIVHGKKIWLF
ncbi:MAG: DUF4422 domain-containing protein [Clostridiales bacterium]|nr:DUF4422 domain-containing protein [Clostridiales bacterium]